MIIRYEWVISPSCVSFSRCIKSCLLFCAAFEKVKNEILRVVALRAHSNSYAFWRLLLFINCKQVPRLVEAVERIAPGRPLLVLCEILAAINLENGLHLLAAEDGNGRMVDGKHRWVLFQGFQWLQWFKIEQRDVFSRVFLRSRQAECDLKRGEGGPKISQYSSQFIEEQKRSRWERFLKLVSNYLFISDNISHHTIHLRSCKLHSRTFPLLIPLTYSHSPLTTLPSAFLILSIAIYSSSSSSQYIMRSIGELEKRVQGLTDQINDIFHATALNLSALGVQLQPYGESRLLQGTLAQCQAQFQSVQELFKQRANLRLQFLITQQIKEEEAKVRRQRLVEYEEKIYDQRRLISDKEAFYEALLKPRRKRPAHMTIEEFQLQRRQELMMEERKNLRRLEEETGELSQIEKALRQDNKELQSILQRLQKEDVSEEELERLASAIQKNPCIYDSLDSMTPRRDQREEVKRLLEGIAAIEKSNEELHKQYMEERQLHQYLRWQHAKLKQEYASKNEERAANELSNRKKLALAATGKYKVTRSLSI